MEVLFISHITYDEDTLKEMYFHACFGRPSILIMIGLMLAILLYRIIKTILNNDVTLLLVTAAAVLFFFGYLLYTYFSYVKKGLQHSKKTGQDTRALTRSVTENAIHFDSHANGADLLVSFTNIKKITCTKNLVLFWTRANQLLALRKDAFTQGTYEDFVAFLAQKGYKIKP